MFELVGDRLVKFIILSIVFVIVVSILGIIVGSLIIGGLVYLFIYLNYLKYQLLKWIIGLIGASIIL